VVILISITTPEEELSPTGVNKDFKIIRLT
jgi:hypothetical protein